jgi:protein tyrosine/serine phosphatase
MIQTSNSAQSLRRQGITAIIFMLALASMAVQAQVADTSSTLTIENFGEVNENFYRGSQPTREQFAQLKRLGIKTIIDLRKDSVREEAEWVRSLGMKYVNIPLRASVAATEEQTNYFLSLVNDPSNGPVYVHCKGGRHRTGALAAVYRITHDGWTADQAFKEMKRYDFDHGFFGGPAAQKRYVYSFYDRYRATANHKGKE